MLRAVERARFLAAAGGRTGRCRDARSKARIRGVRQPPEDLDDARTNLRIEILQQLFLLLDQILGDPRAQPLSGARRVQRRRPSIRRVLARFHIALSNQRADDTAGGALVEEQPFGQSAEPHRPMLGQRLERITLGYRDVVTTNAIPVTKLINPDQISDR